MTEIFWDWEMEDSDEELEKMAKSQALEADGRTWVLILLLPLEIGTVTKRKLLHPFESFL